MNGLPMQQPKRSGERGFTAIEAMIVVFIVATLAAIAFPSMSGMIRAQRVKSAAFDLVADLTFARTEAIARGTDVVMRTADGSSNWGTGWLIVEQAGGTTVREGSATAADIRFVATAPSITFERTGRATAAATVTYSIASTSSDAPDYQKRCVRLDPAGRPRSSIGACP